MKPDRVEIPALLGGTDRGQLLAKGLEVVGDDAVAQKPVVTDELLQCERVKP